MALSDLFGTSMDDPRTMGMLALAGGMVNGGFGHGLLNFGQAYQGAQDSLLKREDLKQQIGLRNIQLQQAQQQFDMMMPVLRAVSDAYSGKGNPSPTADTPTTQSTPAIPPSPSGALGSGTFGIPIGGQPAFAGQPASAQPTQPGPMGSSGSIFGLPRNVAGPILAMGGPGEFAKAIASFNAPTDLIKTLRAQGVPEGSPQWNQALAANVAKTNNLPPTRLGNAGYWDNQQQRFVPTPAAAQPGFINIPDASDPSGFRSAQIGGGVQAVQDSKKAETLGKLGGTVGQGVDENNNPTYFLGPPPGTGPGSATPGAANLPAPVRNNNPGALMPGGKLAQYPSMEAGLQALDQNLQSYGKQGVGTLEGVISKWAPPNENNTPAYIAAVSSRLGLDPKQPIDLSNAATRHALATGIMLQENGAKGVFQAPAAATPAAPAGVIRPSLSATAAALTQQGGDYYKTATNDRQAVPMLRQALEEINKLASDPKNTFGPGTPEVARIKALANNIGIDMTQAQTAQDVMGKLAANITMTQLGQGGQTGTDAQMNQIIHATPNGAMTNAAIQQVVPLLHQQLDVRDARANVIHNVVGQTQNFAKVPDVLNQFNRAASPPVVQLGSQLAQASKDGTLAAFIKGLSPQQRMLLPQVKQLDALGAF